MNLTEIPQHRQRIMHGNIYGTRHSLSYLVSNPLKLDKRQQRIDIIAQVQYGIRVFDLTIRLEKLTGAVTADRTHQKIANPFKSFFNTKMLNYNAMAFRPFITTNQINTDLCVWHVLETLNQTARRCAIAGLIIVVSFIGENNRWIPDQVVQQVFLKQIKAEKFDHLFIILASDLHKLFNRIIHPKKDRRLFINWPRDKETAARRINQENGLITQIIEKRRRNAVSSVGENNVTLVWLTQFNPFENHSFY